MYGIMVMVDVFNTIQRLSEQASQASGTSYDDYIECFTRRCDQTFGFRMSKRTQKIACQYGYIPKQERCNAVRKKNARI